jgi:hypothetical protein
MSDNYTTLNCSPTLTLNANAISHGGNFPSVIPPPQPPTNLLSLGYVNSILLSWTPPSDPNNYNSHFVIGNIHPPYDIYSTPNATVSSYDISGLTVGTIATYGIFTVDIFNQISSIVDFSSSTVIDKIPITIAISGELVQAIPSVGMPIIPWTVISTPIPPPYNGPQYPSNPVSNIIIVYTDTLNNPLPSLPSNRGFYNVYAYIDSSDPYYTGTSATYTMFVKIAIPELLDCSPALTLNAISRGGNFSSAITDALSSQMIATTNAAKVFAQTSKPICTSNGPFISPFSGGITSGAQTNKIIQQQALCTYNQNLAVAKLRQIPGCPINNDQRFAKYQRFPSPVANCPYYHFGSTNRH